MTIIANVKYCLEQFYRWKTNGQSMEWNGLWQSMNKGEKSLKLKWENKNKT